MKKLLTFLFVLISFSGFAQINISVDWKPITDSIRMLSERLAALEARPVGGNYDIANLEEDVVMLKMVDADFTTQLSKVKSDIIALRSRIDNLPTPVDYSGVLNDLDAKILSLEQRLNSLPDEGGGTGTVNVSGLPYSSVSLGFVAGTDITGQLNSKSTGGIILFDGGVYVISGDVQANNTVYEFKNGSRLVSTDGATIHNAIIDAGDYQIFDTNIKLQGARCTDNKVWWTWWGAKKNDANRYYDKELQHGVDQVIANTTLPRTFYGGSGYYHTFNPIIAYLWKDGSYRFCDIVIQGEPQAWKSSEEFGTWIWNHNPQSFAVGFQLVRSSALISVQLRGEAKYEDVYGSYGNLFKAEESTYTSYYNQQAGKNILDSKHAFNGGVVVDPFVTNPNYTATWPNYEAWNRGTGQGGSSAIHIQDVMLMYFTVGISLSPSGGTYNAEDISMERVFFRSNKIGLSIGQTQNKNIQLKNFVAYNVLIVIDGLTHGSQAGAQLVAENGDMANCKMLVNISSQRFPWVFRNMFTEEFYQIGFIDHGAQPVIFENCQFEIVGKSDRVASVAKYVLKGNNVRFVGGYIRTPHAPTFTRMFFSGKDISFIQTTLETPPLFAGTVETANGNANGYFQSVNLLAWESRIGATSVSSQNLEPFRNYVLYGDFTVSSQMIYPNASVKISYNETKYDYSYRLGGGDLSNIVNGTADFQLQHADVYPITGIDINDHIITDVSGAIQALGRVTAIDYTTGAMKLTDVPDNLAEGNYIVWGNYIRRVQRPFVGDVQANSNKIANIRSPFGMPSVGDRVETYVDFSLNSIPIFITAIDGNVATVSRNMVHTEQGVNFAMGDPEITVLSNEAYDQTGKVFLKGTQFKTKR